MNRTSKAVAFAVLCFTWMLPLNSFAAKGAPGGGGGQTPPTGPAVSAPTGVITAGSDQDTFVSFIALSDGRDAPVLTMISGPAGLILYTTSPVDHPHGQNGYTLATYVWTPSRDQIGLSTQAIFKATTQSGGAALVSVSFNVQDVPPGALSGFQATNAGDHIEAHWNPSTTGDPLRYTLTACYMSVLVGTNLPQNYCDLVENTSSLQSLNISTGPSVNIGNPSVKASYYGLFLNAWSGIDGHLMGRLSVNIP